jgi:hypothetical protein
MRTTLTLEPDVADRLRSEATLGKKSFKHIVNAALRRGLGLEKEAPSVLFRVIPHSAALRPGIDPGKLNQLADALEAAEFSRKHARS